MMKSNITEKIKRKKIFLDNKTKIIDLFYIENDFYYSIIYHPTEPWWEPLENSSFHESVCLSSNKIEDSALILLLRTSLQPHEEMYKIVQKKENEHLLDNEYINRLEYNSKK
jgi:hypothetical protein